MAYNTGSSIATHWNSETERMVWRAHLRGVETPFHRGMQSLHGAARDGDVEISSLTSLPFLRVDRQGVLTQQARQSPLLEASILGAQKEGSLFLCGGWRWLWSFPESGSFTCAVDRNQSGTGKGPRPRRGVAAYLHSCHVPWSPHLHPTST